MHENSVPAVAFSISFIIVVKIGFVVFLCFSQKKLIALDIQEWARLQPMYEITFCW